MDDKEVWEVLVQLSGLLTESRALAEDGRVRLASLTTSGQAAVAEASASVQEQQRLLNESVQPDSTADCAQLALQLREAKLQLKKAEAAAAACRDAAAAVAAVEGRVHAAAQGHAGLALLLSHLDAPAAITRSALLDALSAARAAAGFADVLPLPDGIDRLVALGEKLKAAAAALPVDRAGPYPAGRTQSRAAGKRPRTDAPAMEVAGSTAAGGQRPRASALAASGASAPPGRGRPGPVPTRCDSCQKGCTGGGPCGRCREKGRVCSLK
jgi:hypothetical protein